MTKPPKPDPDAPDQDDPHAHAPFADDETPRRYRRTLAFWQQINPAIDLVMPGE